MVGQVLDAFTSRLGGLVGRSACRGLAENAQLAQLMAREPAAPQAGEPVRGLIRLPERCGCSMLSKRRAETLPLA